MRAFPQDSARRGPLSRLINFVQGLSRESLRGVLKGLGDRLSNGDVLSRPPWLSGSHGNREPWRRVPKVNFLSTRQQAMSRSNYLRLGLAALVLVSGILAWNGYRAQGNTHDEATRLDGRLADIVRGRTAVESDVGDLEAAIEALVAEQQQTLIPLETVQRARLAWEAALINLFAVQEPGVELESVQTTAEGSAIAAGVALDVAAMQAYQAQLRGLQGPVELDSLTWSIVERPGEAGEVLSRVEFRAFLTVRPEVADG